MRPGAGPKGHVSYVKEFRFYIINNRELTTEEVLDFYLGTYSGGWVGKGQEGA